MSYLLPGRGGIFSDIAADFWGNEWAEAVYNESLLPACQQKPLSSCPDLRLPRAMAADFIYQMMELTALQ